MLKSQELFQLARDKAKAALEAETPEERETLSQEAEALFSQAKTIKSMEGIISAAGAPQRPVPLPMGGAGNIPPAPPADPAPEQQAGNDAVKAIYTLRFGEEEAAVKAILADLHGPNYPQKRYSSWIAFNRYLRDYTNPVIPAEGRELLFTPEWVKGAIIQGVEVSWLKATMVEARETLGGYIVPADYQSSVISRIAGFTVVRPLATKIQTSRDSWEAPYATGGDGQYTSAVRVTWSPETPTAGAADTNLTFGLKRIPVHTVQAETFMSRNNVEDAAFNLADFLAEKFAEASGIDEDNQFLTGDGVGKPYGLLPGGVNPDTLITEVDAAGTAVAWDDLIGLKYGPDSQYRPRCRWCMEKDTVADIAKLREGSGTGSYLWRYNRDNVGDTPENLLGHFVMEQEAMPSVAASAYPVLFGDFSGYYCVDRIGMSVERYLDSGTARENKVLYLLRRRLGGYPAESWKFAVMKMAAS